MTLKLTIQDASDRSAAEELAEFFEATEYSNQTSRQYQAGEGALAADILVGIAIGVGTGLTANAIYDISKRSVAWLRGRTKQTILLTIEGDSTDRSVTLSADSIPSKDTLRAIADKLANHSANDTQPPE